MLVATRKDNMGVIARYTSSDLKNWEDAGVFFENDMGTDSNLECPTLLEYQGKWYLFYHDCELSNGINHRRCVKFTELTIHEDGTIDTIRPYEA